MAGFNHNGSKIEVSSSIDFQTYGATGSLLGTSSYAISASWAPSAGGSQNLQDVTTTGNSTTASVIMGHQTNTANGLSSVSIGTGSKADGVYSHAEGQQTLASSAASHAEGYQTSASSWAAHAEGWQSIATGVASHAEGDRTSALGQNSHAEGSQTIAIGAQSHVEGNISTTMGLQSHAEGRQTTTIGNWSHAEGRASRPIGDYSHAEGFQTTSLGIHSHAEGIFTIATKDNQHAEGQYNLEDANALWVLGDGISTAARSNVAAAYINKFTISGSLEVDGAITGSLNGTSSHAVSSSYALSASWAPSAGGGSTSIKVSNNNGTELTGIDTLTIPNSKLVNGPSGSTDAMFRIFNPTSDVTGFAPLYVSPNDKYVYYNAVFDFGTAFASNTIGNVSSEFLQPTGDAYYNNATLIYVGNAQNFNGTSLTSLFILDEFGNPTNLEDAGSGFSSTAGRNGVDIKYGRLTENDEIFVKFQTYASANTASYDGELLETPGGDRIWGAIKLTPRGKWDKTWNANGVGLNRNSVQQTYIEYNNGYVYFANPSISSNTWNGTLVDTVLWRVDANTGALDTTFTTNVSSSLVSNLCSGCVKNGNIQVNTLGLSTPIIKFASDNKIYVGSFSSQDDFGNPETTHHGILRFNVDGTLDTSFNDPVVTYDESGFTQYQNDIYYFDYNSVNNKLYVLTESTGTSSQKFLLAASNAHLGPAPGTEYNVRTGLYCLDSSGNLDTTFNSAIGVNSNPSNIAAGAQSIGFTDSLNSTSFYSLPSTVRCLSDGTILIMGGSFDRWKRTTALPGNAQYILRLNTDGTAKSGFLPQTWNINDTSAYVVHNAALYGQNLIIAEGNSPQLGDWNGSTEKGMYYIDNTGALI